MHGRQSAVRQLLLQRAQGWDLCSDGISAAASRRLIIPVVPWYFQALDLERRSSADPRQLLAAMAADGMSQPLAVNDLEQPAFDMRALGVFKAAQS